MGQTKTIAVVLAGAVAKGAFEAGVIRALSFADVEIVRVVAASSGALNGTVLASAVRARDLRAGAETLVELWQHRARWSKVFRPSLRGLFHREGLSDHRQQLALLHDHIKPLVLADPAPVNLRLIVAALCGTEGSIGDRAATTFEAICDFAGDDFASRERLDRVFAAALASAAFPIVFAPVDVPGLGPCIDGGIVNNTPMKWALDGEIGAAIDAIVVVATSVEHRTRPPDDLHGIGLLGHIADMLVEERLYRDLREAATINAGLDALDGLAGSGALDRAQLAQVKDALGWTGRRVVDIVSIRPEAELAGNAFAGFFDEERRTEYLEAGYRRGLEVLRGHGFALRRSAGDSVRDDDVVRVAGDAVVLPGAVERDRAE